MRLLLISYFFSIFAVGFAQQKDSLYDLGLEALSKKEFNAAQDYFRKNIEISPSFESYYNLGYAYAEQKMWLESLWANEAALKYDPTNRKAIFNAKFSLKKLDKNVEWKHPYSWTERFILSLGKTAWIVLLIISSLIVAISAYFLISTKKNSAKRFWSKRIILPFVVIFIVAIFCFNKTVNHFESNRFAYVIDKETQLYLSPDGLEVDENLQGSLRLNVVIEQARWIKILTPDFYTFWLKKEDALIY